MINDVALLCRLNPLEGTGLVENFTGRPSRWWQNITRQGGYWMAEAFFPLGGKNTAAYLSDWFDGRLGYRVESRAAGTVSWEGIVWEMELTLNGSKRRRSLAEVRNKIRADYVDGAGKEQSTSWYENTESQARYGIREEIIEPESTSATEAETEAQTELARRAEAWVRQVAVDTEGRMEPGLSVYCVGDVFTANNRYVLPAVADGSTALTSAYATNIIDTYCEYLSSTDIQTSNLTVTKRLARPTRAWEVLRLLAQMGDQSGGEYRPWEVQVRQGGNVSFAPADTQPLWQWTRDGLRNWGGGMPTWLAWPGVLRDRTRPPGKPIPGSFLTDRRDSFIEELEWATGATMPSLKPAEFDEQELLSAMANYERWLESGGAPGGGGRPVRSSPPGNPGFDPSRKRNWWAEYDPRATRWRDQFS